VTLTWLLLFDVATKCKLVANWLHNGMGYVMWNNTKQVSFVVDAPLVSYVHMHSWAVTVSLEGNTYLLESTFELRI